MKKLLIPILSVMLLTACNNGGNSSSSRTHRSSYNDSWVSLSTDEVSEGQIGGSLIEINTGTPLVVNDNYTCSFVPSAYANKKIKLRSTDESVATVSKVEGSESTFVVSTHKIGDTILIIYAEEDDYIVYRKVLNVRREYSKEEVEDIVFDKYDIWKSTGIYGSYNMTFIGTKPLVGTLNGRDDYENTYLNFTLKFRETTYVYDFKYHCYDVELDLENSSTGRVYTELDISVTGENILFYYEEGLLELFYPKLSK